MINGLIFIFLLVVQAISIISTIYLWNLEETYCKKCSWWSDTAKKIIIATAFIPVFGIAVPFASIFDITRNVIEQIKEDYGA